MLMLSILNSPKKDLVAGLAGNSLGPLAHAVMAHAVKSLLALAASGVVVIIIIMIFLRFL